MHKINKDKITFKMIFKIKLSLITIHNFNNNNLNRISLII